MATEWYTPPLQAVTLGGRAKFNIRALESNAAANASLKAEIAVVNGDGTSPVVWGVGNIEPGTVAGELGTTDAAYIAWVSGDDVSVTAGQRLRFRIYVDDIASGPLVTGHTVTVSYNGATPVAAGDTYVILPVTIVEQVSGTAWTQPIDDTLPLSDSVATESGKTASIPDTLALTDSVTSQAAFARTIPDTLALADSVAFQRDVTLPLADTLTLADLAAAQRGIVQALGDTITLADLATTAAGKGVTLADTVALADALTSQAAFLRGLADTLSLADTVAAQSAFQLSIVDTLALADSLASQAAFVRALADTLTLADLVDPVKGVGGVAHTQPVADTVSLADALTAGSDLTRAIADSLALADSLTAQKASCETWPTRSASPTRSGSIAPSASPTRSHWSTRSASRPPYCGRSRTRSAWLMRSPLAENSPKPWPTYSPSPTASRSRQAARILLEDTLTLADLLSTLLVEAIGEPPKPTGRIDFPGIGTLTRPTNGVRAGAVRGRTDTSLVGDLAQTTRGVPV